MSSVFYLILRRLRVPLIMIVVIYTLCTMGLSVMPGVDEAGHPTPGMGLFHAFYIISYTGTTIGFGEIPVPFSPEQRLWMIASIYATVSAWTYAGFNVIGLIGERGFRQALAAARFNRMVGRLREPFYIVCGYGETGRLVCEGLDRLGLRFVIVENAQERIDEAVLDEFSSVPPKTMADAAQPTTLTSAGLLSRHCRGVMALAVDDETNQAIAVTCRLLRPTLPVLARMREPDFDTHLGVFGRDIVINPFERFAEHLSAALVAPEQYRLRELLTSLPDDPIPPLHTPPIGHWIVCGYGRFGHAIVAQLRAAGQSVSVVDLAHYAEGGVDVKGRGIEPGTLKQAGIEQAVGIVIGNASDQRNLAIAVHARDLKPDIYVVCRQNQTASQPLFDAFDEDLVMEPSRLVAQEFLAVITTPLLGAYLNSLNNQTEPSCTLLSSRIERLNPGQIPETWGFRITLKEAPALHHAIKEGRIVPLRVLLRDPSEPSRPLRALPLMLRRTRKLTREPDLNTPLHIGDEFLFVGHPRARRAQEFARYNDNTLDYLLTGSNHATSWVWQRLVERRRPPLNKRVDAVARRSRRAKRRPR